MEWGEAAALKRFSPEKAQKVGLFKTDRSMTDLHCLLPGQSQKPHIHERSDKVYYVIEGRGRMKVGGRITDWARRPVSIENGRGSAGTTAVGARDITIQKGDMLIIPAGTPHKWELAEEFTAYAVVRVDPDGVAPLLELGMAKFIAPTP